MKAEASEFSTKSTLICTARRKVSFEKVLVSAVNDWSGDRAEGKEVSDWIGIGSSVSEVMGILEYVFVGIWK